VRIDEACHLRIADIDSKQMLLHVRHAKGGKLLSEAASKGYKDHCAAIYFNTASQPNGPSSRSSSWALMVSATEDALIAAYSSR
jgi:phage gp37-like protein